jgi:hypothetical protein
LSASLIPGGGGAQAQAVDLALVCVDHLELEALDMRDFVARRHVPEGVHHDAADRVELLVAELHLVEIGVEVLDRRQRFDEEVIVADATNELVLLGIGFILDLTDDLLEHVLDRHQARNATVLVDHDRHVVAVLAELAQQYVETLALRHHRRPAQQFADVEARAIVVEDVGQEVLGEKDAEHVVGFSPMTG